VATVKVELVPVVDGGLKVAVEPEGWPLALSPTASLKPPVREIVTV
jgi:hypothetical protein